MKEKICPYCEIEISDHEANRCLDAWISEAVMGIEVRVIGDPIGDFLPVVKNNRGSYYAGHSKYLESPAPLYSTDISAAWEIVVKLTDETQRFELITGHQDIAWIVGEKSGPKLGLHICCVGDTMPHAICRAALKCHLSNS